MIGFLLPIISIFGWLIKQVERFLVLIARHPFIALIIAVGFAFVLRIYL
jgi:hypothetical protein